MPLSIKQIPSKCAGCYHETTVDILGTSYPLIVGYTEIKGYQQTELEPCVDNHVEINCVYVEIEGDFHEINPSEAECETLAENIQETLA